MSKIIKFAGTSLGLATSILLIWLGYQHFLNTQKERLPITVKQKLVELQKQLPIQLSRTFILENFSLRRSSVELIVRGTEDLNYNISKKKIELQLNLFICFWRSKFLIKDPLEYVVKLLDKNGDEFASIKNTSDTCANIPKITEKNIQL